MCRDPRVCRDSRVCRDYDGVMGEDRLRSFEMVVVIDAAGN